MQEYDTALVLYDKWYSMYRETLLNTYDYVTFSDEYKFALIKTGKDKEKGLRLIEEKMQNLYQMQEGDAFNYAGGQYYDLMRLNAVIGKNEEALKFFMELEKAEFAFGSISWATIDPLLKDLRSDPQFSTIIERGWERKWEIQEQVRKMEAEEDLKMVSRR